MCVKRAGGRDVGGHDSCRDRAKHPLSLRSGYIYLLRCPLGGYSLQGCSGPLNRKKQAFRPNLAFKKGKEEEKSFVWCLLAID